MASVSVTFYSGFKKRRNSTKQPTGGTSLSCLLKENTTVEAPTFIIKEDGSSYTYCSAFGNYYYVTKREYVPPHWHMHCAMDYMATFKTDIGSSSQYIERANATWGVADNRLLDQLPTETGPTTSFSLINGGESPIFPSANSGSYVVTIAGNTMSGTGAYYWTFSPSEFETFMATFMNNFGWSDPASLLTDQMKALIEPQNWIQDIRWYPFECSHKYESKSPVYCGAWNTQAEGWVMSDTDKFTNLGQFLIPKHPQSSTEGLFLNSSTYSTYTLIDPFFGVISIDGNSICDCSVINYDIEVDPTCGFGHMRLSASVNNVNVILTDRTTEFGVPCFMTYQSRDFLSSIQGVNPLAIGGNLAKTIAFPKTEVTGSVASRVMYQWQPVLACEFYRIKPLNPALQGRPVCATYTINSFSGYVKCFSGEVNTIGNPEAKAEVKSFLEGGFFYE